MIKKWGLAQLNSGNDIDKNLKTALKFIREAAAEKCDMLVFPEYFLFRDSHQKMFKNPFSLSGPVVKKLTRAAQTGGINLLAGTLPLADREDENIIYNTALFITKNGEIGGYYQKIHLFDAELDDEFSVNESDYIEPGEKIVDLEMADIHCGLAICYDLRFPELFRKLAQKHVQAIVIPANFTRETGRAHWEALLRARAIENQCYVVAANQIGPNPGTKIAAFGQSMVVDPWGQVIARASDTECWLGFHIDLKYLHEVRRQLPVLNHIELL
ncbi:MAG: carbon-nitrogen hydrolase family protein [bacterium]